MRTRVLEISTAALIAIAATTGAMAASKQSDTPPALKLTHAQSNVVTDALSCHASCSSGHLQCLSDGLDYSLVSSPSDGVERIGSNLSVRSDCARESFQCHASCN